jgi:4-amino-4-deoxy-L-arabinose transferase-like glycosyltransferase
MIRLSSRWSALSQSVAAPIIASALLRSGLMIAAYLRTGTNIMTQGDTASYLEPGRNLLLHGLYATAGLPEIDRTPGYPLFAMLTGMLYGQVLLTALAQIILSAISVLLIWKIAQRVFPSERTALLAAWLFAIEPVSIMYSVRLMPETLFVLLLLLTIDKLLDFLATARVASLVIAGLWLAYATFVRPVSYYLVFAIAVAVSVIEWRKKEKRTALWWKAPIILLLCVTPFVAAWQLRSKIETGYSGFSSIVEKNLYFYQSAEVTAELHHITLAAEQKDLGYTDEISYLTIHPEQHDWSQAQRLTYMRAQAVQILSANRTLYLKTHIAGVGVVAFTPCASELLQLVGLYPGSNMMPRRLLNEGILSSMKRVATSYPLVAMTMVVLEVYLLFLYLFALLALWKGSGKGIPIVTLVCIVLYFLFISGGAQAVGRYRLPIMPELCILAAGGLTQFGKREVRGHKDPAQ